MSREPYAVRVPFVRIRVPNERDLDLIPKRWSGRLLNR